ncbi:hypothetical protein [Dokdonia sp.]|uniref:hypothetical protein n=1 Tax=Dokdonia sp. TaxID=2024995 RepID=UPI003263CE44
MSTQNLVTYKLHTREAVAIGQNSLDPILQSIVYQPESRSTLKQLFTISNISNS